MERRASSFSHTGRRGNRFVATANHHCSRLTEALISRLSFSPLREKVAEPERSAGRSDEGCWTERGAPSWNTPHPSRLRLDTFSHTGRRGNRFIATANHHLRFCGRETPRLSFSPCGRRWPSRSEAQGRSDEGCWTERGAPSWNTPHPSRLRLDTFSHTGEKGEPLHCHGQSPPFEISRSADIAPLLLPLAGEGGRAGAKRRGGRMRGAGRSAARQAGTPLIRLGFASTPSPTRGEGEALHRHGQSPSEILRTRKRRASPSPTRGEGPPRRGEGGTASLPRQPPSEIC